MVIGKKNKKEKENERNKDNKKKYMICKSVKIKI
jgi:hypothetical protein